MFEFSQPWALLFLPLPWLLRLLLSPTEYEQWVALKTPFFYRLRQINSHSIAHPKLHRQQRLTAFTIWGLLILAAMGPQWLGKPVEILQQGRNIFLAMDISGSMQIPDMEWEYKPVDRLTVVKEVGKKFVAGRKGDRLGLVLFGSKAYLQTPLTFDKNTVNYMLDDATIGLAGPQTAMGDAIGLAIKRLENTPKESRVIVLLTDGVSNTGVLSPMQAANLAKAENIRIYTIGLGADEMLIRGLLGSQYINPSNDLDEDALKQIAETTGGMYFRAKDTEGLQKTYKKINNLEPVIANSNLFRPKNAIFYWPLSIAFLLSLAFVFGRVQPKEVPA